MKKGNVMMYKFKDGTTIALHLHRTISGNLLLGRDQLDQLIQWKQAKDAEVQKILDLHGISKIQKAE